MKRSISPLRYPGGKASIYSIAKDVINSHNFSSCQYAEPYAGGCGLALLLLFDGIVSEIFINDIDPSIAFLWDTILENPEELIERISLCKLNMEEWYKQQEMQKNKDSVDPLDLAFSTLYLNRTNHSGIIKAGVMGGKNQDGKYKMDCRFNKKVLIQKVKAISEKKNAIHVYNLDAIDFIKVVESYNLSNPLLMVDPPYYNKGKTLYTNFYEHEDHALIADSLKQTYIPWLLTYDNTPEISKLYEGYIQFQFDINYSAQNKRVGSELFIASSEFDSIDNERLKKL